MAESRCSPAVIKFKRGSQIYINGHIPLDGEPVYTVDTNRLFIGMNQKTGGHSILVGDVSNIEKMNFYGTNGEAVRGFHPFNTEIIIYPDDGRYSGAAQSTHFDVLQTMHFDDTTGETAYFMIPISPYWSHDLDINVRMLYTIDGGSLGDSIQLDSDIWLITTGEAMGGAPDYSYTDYITVGSDNWGVIQETGFSNLKIPNAALGPKVRKVILKLTRKGPDDSFGGDLHIVDLTVEQIRDGSIYGYVCGGYSRTSETDTNPSIISTMNRILFPFNDSAAVSDMTLGVAASSCMGFNSSRHGYICGGYTVEDGAPNFATSSVQRYSFPLNSGATTTIGSLSEGFANAGSANSSRYGYLIGGLPSERYSYAARQLVEKIDLAFDEFVSSSSSFTIDIPIVRTNTFNSSSYAYAIGGVTNTGAVISTAQRISFANDSGSTIGSTTVTNYADAQIEEVFDSAGCNSSTHGFTLGGFHIRKVHKYTFPLDSISGPSTVYGNLSYSKSRTVGFNSTTHGYVCGGGNYTNHGSYANGRFFSTVERINFAFTSGDAVVVGNLASSQHDRNAALDGVDFVTQFV